MASKKLDLVPLDLEPVEGKKLDLVPLDLEPINKQASKPQAALESFGQGLLAGYLPQAQAATELGLSKIVDPVIEAISGQEMQPVDYTKSRDVNIARMAEQEKQYPALTTGSRIAGGLIQGIATPLPKALTPASLLGSVGKGAAVGAGYGLLQNPGDVEGEVNVTQIPERLKGAAQGAALGGAIGPAAYGISKGLTSLSKSSDKLDEMANEFALRQSGVMLKDVRQLESKGQIQEFGKFLRSKGLVKAGDTFETVSQKADELRKLAGQKLSDLYGKASEAQQKHFQDINKNFQTLPESKIKEFGKMGFSLERDKEEILAAASKALGNDKGKASALTELSNYLDERAAELGNEILDPKTAQDIKTSIDRAINYSRNPLTKQPTTEKAFEAARKVVADKIESQIDYLAKRMGTTGAKALKEANREYGFAKKATEIAQDYANRDQANRFFSLTDTITGAGGLVGGGIGAMAGGPGGMGAGSIIGGLAGATANKLARQYGSGIAASGLGGLSKAAEYTIDPTARLLQGVLPRRAIERGLLQENLRK